MNCTVRLATIEDAVIACIAVRSSITECCVLDHGNDALVLENWLKNKTPKNFCSWLSNSENLAVVAVIEAGIVGFAMATSAGQIQLCYVVRKALFQGVGKALLSALEEMLGASGRHTITLESTLTARPFYERNGFALAGDPVRAMGLMATPMVKHIFDKTGLTARSK